MSPDAKKQAEEMVRALYEIAEFECADPNIFGSRCRKCPSCIAKDCLRPKCKTCGAPILLEDNGYCDVDCAQYPGTPRAHS